MIDKATSPQLDQVFERHGAEVQTATFPAIDGIIKEADEGAGDVADTSVLHAALIAAGQAVEHDEMTRSGSLVAWAKQLNRPDCTGILS